MNELASQRMNDYRTRILSSLAEVDASQWNALLAQQAQPTPFLRHEFLNALQATRCATVETGWSAQFITLWRDAHDANGRAREVLAAATPLYVKQHSYGEYVFDWAWADAYQRHGLRYYPKLLCAVPFTPVQGTRLMADCDESRRRLAATLVSVARHANVSSLHVLYPEPGDAELLVEAGMLLREGMQFHWLNRGYHHFNDFLSTLEHKKRKNIRAERRKVRNAGVTLRRVPGEAITAKEWAFFSRCYRQTYREHHSSPYLNLDFFRTIGATMPENLLLVIAERAGAPIASSLLVYERTVSPSRGQGKGVLYGRYWGALEHVPCLHFETAYYQPLEFCIEAGVAAFEGGAQGEHKMARGFLPALTYSTHWLAHPAFADAVARFLDSEAGGIHRYMDELREHDPFRCGAQAAC
ncbi:MULTISPECIES: GNAT family N-acetyltransferase [Mycetohabitans]|uniref:N-acetyltransferase n=1 Tax=Mycetohabitans endofungorum TaxID=417203 RepID=A0A2P5KE94_9BURK|nr:hypothetical protein B0O95_101107 [Mycetohabitans endofungorum]